MQEVMIPDMDRTDTHWAALMRAAIGGDDAAYRQLLDALAGRFRAATRARLARMGRGNADIEDIVQDALLAIHLKRHTWDQNRSFTGWANAVLQHKIIDRLRSQNIRMHDDISDHIDIAADTEEEGTTGDLTRILDALDPQNRRIVTAIAIEGRSAAEVGIETGRSEGAVRVALHRALGRLAALYRDTRGATS